MDLIFKNYRKYLQSEFGDREISGLKLIYKNHDEENRENTESKDTTESGPSSIREYFKMSETSKVRDLEEHKKEFQEKVNDLLVETEINQYFDSRAKIEPKKLSEIKLFLREICSIVKRKNILSIKEKIKVLNGKINVNYFAYYLFDFMVFVCWFFI